MKKFGIANFAWKKSQFLKNAHMLKKYENRVMTVHSNVSNIKNQEILFDSNILSTPPIVLQTPAYTRKKIKTKNRSFFSFAPYAKVDDVFIYFYNVSCPLSITLFYFLFAFFLSFFLFLHVCHSHLISNLWNGEFPSCRQFKTHDKWSVSKSYEVQSTWKKKIRLH